MRRRMPGAFYCIEKNWSENKMLQLELKRIFSKKINVFAIILAFILAGVFSGFAVTSNRYVDENGAAEYNMLWNYGR